MNDYKIGEKKILLYGAASRGSIVKDICEHKNCEVVGFIDQRATEIKQFCGLPVYSLNDIQDKFSDKDKYMVYINLKNVFEHDKVALQLLDKGFHNILFRPGRYLDGTGNMEEYRLNECYDLVVTADSIAKIAVPVVKNVRFPEIKDNCLININSADDTVIIKCITPLLYSDYTVKESKWTDKNIYALYPHEQLFRAIAGEKEADITPYIEMCKSAAKNKGVEITESWETSLLKNRTEVFDNMQKSWDFDPDFFERNAIEADWNANGYFNINSGKHRCLFLISKGMGFSYLKVKKGDYDNCLNKAFVGEVYNWIKDNRILKLDYPIEHPMFINYPCNNYSFYLMLLKYITQLMSKSILSKEESFKGKSIFVHFNDGGFLKRHFERMGMDVYTDCIPTECEYLIGKLLKKERYLTQRKTLERYDFLICDDSFNYASISADKIILLGKENTNSKYTYFDNLLIKQGCKYYLRFIDEDSND